MMDWKGRIATSVLEGFQRCHAQSIFTDIEVEVNSVVFKCHKVFLCAISDFFHAMFQSGMRESVNNRIQLSGLSSSTFRDVLTFYYDGEDKVITHDTVEELLRAAGLLQLECLQRRCEAYYADHLYPENALGIWKLATCLGCKQLEELARIFLLRHFGSISQEAEFLSLELELLTALLGDSDLRVSSEDVVCAALTQWVQHDPAARALHLPGLLDCLCLHMLSGPCYANLLAFSKFVCAASSSCSSSSFLLPPEHPRRHSLVGGGVGVGGGGGSTASTTTTSSSSTTTGGEVVMGRRSRNYEEMLVVLGVHKSTKMLPAVHAYSFTTAAWYKLDPLPFDPGVGYATCVHDNHLYISGISLRKGYMLQYDCEDNAWREVAEMPDRRRYHEAVVTGGDFVYAVGGCNKRDGASSGVTRYCTVTDAWKTVGHLQLGVYSASATFTGDVILVFGGRAHGSVRRREIQAFDLRTNTSVIITHFSTPVTESKALTVADEAFVALTNGSVLKVSEDGTIYPHATVPNFDRYNFGFVRRPSGVLVVGGETRYPSSSGSGHFADFIQVDADAGKVSVLSDQLFPLASAACCCMVIIRRTAFPKLSS